MRLFNTSWLRIVFGACLLLTCAPAGSGFGQESTRPLYAPALISLADARIVIGEAIDYAQTRNLRMAVVVMDHTGNVVSSDRMDGAPFRNLHEAEGKAYAAALYGRPTQELAEFEQIRPERYFGITNMYPGKVYLIGGGLPLILDNIVVGAVGIAGLPQGVGDMAGREAISRWLSWRGTE